MKSLFNIIHAPIPMDWQNGLSLGSRVSAVKVIALRESFLCQCEYFTFSITKNSKQPAILVTRYDLSE